MKNGYTKGITLLIGLFCMSCVLGCHHTVAKAQPQVPPAPATPAATLAANPANIDRGQATTLTWQTTNATDVTIQGLGTVPATGSRSIYPSESTSYELVAKGAGGTADVSARVTVNTPYARQEQGTDGRGPDSVLDVYFDYDRFNIRPDQMVHVQTDAQYLENHGAMRILIEGHCDDRGSLEYNLALGAQRASAVQQALTQMGVPTRRLQTVSYGKEKPFCKKDSEECWQENRRGHFTERQ
ncbi:MAG TPA: peptidoglycan-associated lipoprotein Pal [Candidatus Acidoferrales bacterium]|nr:peptidoglycan-associated lipoprotein Pal [Candidatus Acidoferrales bacterium]